MKVHSFRYQPTSTILREGKLTKLRAKDGGPETHHFVLREDSLSYIKQAHGNVMKQLGTGMYIQSINPSGHKIDTALSLRDVKWLY